MTPMRDRLLAKCEPVTESGCWIWTGASVSKWYGSINTGKHGKSMLAHRASYIEFKGQIPDGLHICHRCDVSYCINPDHLFLGTNLDNIHDSMKKGRRHGWSCNRPTGLKYKPQSEESREKRALLKKDTRESLKKDRADGLSYMKLAAKYCCSFATAYRVVNGR